MASPQKDNGYTTIANELLEQLVKAGLLGSELSVCLFVIRKTYGYQKKADMISLTQFEKGTGLSRPTVVKTLKNLKQKQLITFAPLIGFSINKDWEKWVVNTPLLVKSKWEFGKPDLTESGKPALTHKRKKEITKEIRSEALEFNKKLFEYHKELTGIDFKDTSTDRMRYPRLIRQKFALEDVLKTMYWAWNQRKKSDGFYYWREGRMTLAKLYHRLIPEYLEAKKGVEQTKKYEQLKQGFNIGK